jgi:uncharacterized protein (DUF362 family)
MLIAVKANLVGPFKPDSAAVTHPALLAALTKLLVRQGAIVTVGDSPAAYTAGFILTGLCRRRHEGRRRSGRQS